MRSTPRGTVYIETYGCKMNVSDSELMYGRLAEFGYEAVDRPDGADVILVNTCAIRDHAEQRVLGRLGELKRHMRPDTVLGVTGCMAQRLGPKLLDEARHVDLVIGPDGYRALPSLVEGARQGVRAAQVEFDLEEHYEDFRARRLDGVRAWIPGGGGGGRGKRRGGWGGGGGGTPGGKSGGARPRGRGLTPPRGAPPSS